MSTINCGISSVWRKAYLRTLIILWSEWQQRNVWRQEKPVPLPSAVHPTRAHCQKEPEPRLPLAKPRHVDTLLDMSLLDTYWVLSTGCMLGTGGRRGETSQLFLKSLSRQGVDKNKTQEVTMKNISVCLVMWFWLWLQREFKERGE